MNKLSLKLCVMVIALCAPSQVKAGDIFNSLDRALSTVEKTMDTTDRTMSRAGNVKKRVADKIPAGKASANKLTAEEEETLRKAEEIEERRILREAEAIRRRR